MAKVRFRAGGYAIHGGAHALLQGRSVSLGCVRTAEAALLDLLDWLHERGALGPLAPRADGERYQHFARPARLLIR